GLHSDPSRRHAPPCPDPGVVGALQRVIAHERPEVVHAHNWLVHSFVPLKPWSKARLVLTLHDYGLRCAQKRLMYHGATPCSGPGLFKCLGCAVDKYGAVVGVPTTLANWVMGMPERAAVDMFIPVSNAVAVGNGLVGTRLPFEVIPNFVPDSVADLRGGVESYLEGLPEGEFILFVGDLDRDKGLHILLQSYSELRDAPPLVLIGRPRAGTPTAFPPNVIVRTNWPHDAVMWAWHRSLMAVVPSVVPDSCPTVAIEAMATGRPVIASRIGGLTDQVIEGETGFLVPPNDPIALRAALERLLADPALREMMGRAAKRKAVEFTAERVVPRIERVYRRLLADGPIRADHWKRQHVG
ncbi:MAG: glycosyltransferase family 4 protein, partial [Thermomicrobia bacterium]|nr:glycosyltransferase family 4 protein [Thermomicrobia bacterium]